MFQQSNLSLFVSPVVTFANMALQKVASVDKQRLLLAYERGQDYVQLSSQLGIKADTAYRIIKRTVQRNGVVEVPRGGKRREKVDAEMKLFVENLLEENPALTLKSINNLLQHRLPHKPHVSDRTIGNICDALLYTVKNLQLQPVNRNAIHIKEERISYANWFLQDAILMPFIVFVDESGFNMWTCRSQGRSKKGTPATKVVCNQRGGNVTLLLAISPQIGVVHSMFSLTSTTKLLFQEFINSVVNAIPQDGRGVVVMDNAPIHSGVTSPRPDVVIKFLPPYSPPLNPIEEAFSCWKADLKSILSQPHIHALVTDGEAATNAGMTMQQWRSYHLRQLGINSLLTITHTKCQNFMNHSLGFLHRCLNSEDI